MSADSLNRWLQFTRTIRKSASSKLSAASQLIFAHQMLQLYYIISVIISNPPIAVKCVPCVDFRQMPLENHRFPKHKKACGKQSFSTCLFSFFFCQKQRIFPYHLLTIPLQCCWDKCPGYDTVLVKNVMSDYLSGTTVISSEKQLFSDRLCPG